MIKINIVCVGNLKDKEYISLAEEYQKRLSRFAKINVVELKEKNSLSNINQIIESETADILQNIDVSKTVLLDKDGELISSPELASFVDKWSNNNSELTFVIGGSYGVSDYLRQNATKKISFGRMTFPHRLARIMLLEQIYRAFTINNNISYHK